MNKKIYDIDYNKLVQWLTPPLLRKASTIAWLLTLTKPVVALYQQFTRYRKQKLYELMITPQVCYLEMMLNDKYDFIQRRIRIVDSVDKAPTYFYRRDELKPVSVYKRSENKPNTLYTRGESGEIKDDFIILVPAAIFFNNQEMLQLVKGYRLAAMKPKIQRV